MLLDAILSREVVNKQSQSISFFETMNTIPLFQGECLNNVKVLAEQLQDLEITFQVYSACYSRRTGSNVNATLVCYLRICKLNQQAIVVPFC
jgi:hypothetical protein